MKINLGFLLVASWIFSVGDAYADYQRPPEERRTEKLSQQRHPEERPSEKSSEPTTEEKKPEKEFLRSPHSRQMTPEARPPAREQMRPEPKARAGAIHDQTP